MRPSSTGCSAGDQKISSVIADLEALMTRVYPGRASPGFLTTSKDLKGSLCKPIESLSKRANRTDVSFAASLFLARKVIPSAESAGQAVDSYVSKMGRNQTPNTRFVAHIDREVERLFPLGWDSHYVSLCGAALPKTGSSFGTSRKKGGSRAEIQASYQRSDFVHACATGRGIEIGADRRIHIIDDNGKLRLVTLADARQHCLGPLHHLLYNHLSAQTWLLKGDATANRFSEFERVKGEIFVSGDYEAATDNFNRFHSEALLRAIRARSRNVPGEIWELALASLSGNIVTPDGVSHPQVAGQLMGNLLSFPLLCLTNYIAFRYAIRRKVPLRINGDDIVFRATPQEAQRWMDIVGDAGLTLSRGKTMTHERYFSLNSTFFEGRFPSRLSQGMERRRKPSLIPAVRAKCIYAPLQKGDGMSLAARLYKCCNGMMGWQKGVIKGHLLRWHRSAVAEVGCSINRALGARVTHDALASANLLQQEVAYLSLPAKIDRPRRSERVTRSVKYDTDHPATWGWVAVPDSWFPSEASRDYARGRWGDHCLKYAWDAGYVLGGEDDARRRLLPPLLVFQAATTTRRIASLMGTTRKGLTRLRRSADRKIPGVRRWLYNWEPRRKEPVTWVPEELRSLLRPPPKLVSSLTGYQWSGNE